MVCLSTSSSVVAGEVASVLASTLASYRSLLSDFTDVVNPSGSSEASSSAPHHHHWQAGDVTIPEAGSCQAGGHQEGIRADGG